MYKKIAKTVKRTKEKSSKDIRNLCHHLDILKYRLTDILLEQDEMTRGDMDTQRNMIINEAKHILDCFWVTLPDDDYERQCYSIEIDDEEED